MIVFTIITCHLRTEKGKKKKIKAIFSTHICSVLNSPFYSAHCITPVQVDGKVADGLLGDANGVEPPPGRAKDSVKWQKPRFSRKALMKCCLVRWIIASTQPQDKGERHTPATSSSECWRAQRRGLLTFLWTLLTCWPQGLQRAFISIYFQMSQVRHWCST